MIQRRVFLQRGLQVFGAALPLASNAQSAVSRFRGTTLRINYPAHPHYDRVERQFTRFTAQTGIRIEGHRTPYLEMKKAQLASFAKPTGDFDLVSYLILWKVEYAQQGYLSPLEPYFANPQLAMGNFYFDDLINPYVDAIGRVGGPKSYLPGPGAKLYGLPCGSETSVLGARKDLLAKYDLAMPTDYSDLFKACRVLHEKEGIGGLATRGQAGHHITHAWLLHLTPHAGTVFDAEWNSVLHNHGGVQAVEALREIAAMAPEGVAKATFAEMQENFLQGRSAFYLDSSSVLGVGKDAKHTKLTDRFVYAMHPSGSRLSGQTGGFGLGIAANSPQSEVAFMLLQWLTSPGVDLAIAREGGAAGRWSTLADPDFKAANPEQAIMPFALRAANPDWRPLIPEWDKISKDITGRLLPEMVYGSRPVAAGLASISAEVDAEMLRTGRRLATPGPARKPTIRSNS